jgi:uncharacterized membrane protein YdbT with pleckstrin-like domain
MEKTDKVIKKFHSHPLAFLGFYFSGFFFIVIGLFFLPLLIALGLAVLLLGEVSRRAETFLILDNGVERLYSLLSTSKKFIEYEKIQNLEVSQSFFENLFGVGSIKFDTAGTSEVELYFHTVKDPYSIETLIRENMAQK